MNPMTFKGWPIEAVEFYEGLQADNSKPYWQDHKAVYEQCVRVPMELLLVELADDDRATLYGAFLTVAAKLRGEEREQALGLWKRKGKRAFEMDTELSRICN